MEIKNNLNKLDPHLNRVKLESPASRQAAEVGESSATGDTVSIKSSALRSAIANEAKAAPDIRQEKVDAIKASIANGTYAIDSKAIAAKLVQAGSELF